MDTFHNAIGTEELKLIIEQLSSEVSRMHQAGPSSFHDVQQAASSLTRAQLVLNELVRVELREQGVNQDMAERFADLENRIRVLRDQIYQLIKCRVPVTS